MAKSLLTLDLKNNGYFDASALFNDLVRIIEDLVLPLREQAANRGLTRVHHSNEKNISFDGLRGIGRDGVLHAAILAKPSAARPPDRKNSRRGGRPRSLPA